MACFYAVTSLIREKEINSLENLSRISIYHIEKHETLALRN